MTKAYPIEKHKESPSWISSCISWFLGYHWFRATLGRRWCWYATLACQDPFLQHQNRRPWKTAVFSEVEEEYPYQLLVGDIKSPLITMTIANKANGCRPLRLLNKRFSAVRLMDCYLLHYWKITCSLCLSSRSKYTRNSSTRGEGASHKSKEFKTMFNVNLLLEHRIIFFSGRRRKEEQRRVNHVALQKGIKVSRQEKSHGNMPWGNRKGQGY